MIVAPVTVYGARSVTVTGSNLASRSVPPATLRQALLGKVMTVGDSVSLLPRDLGPGTSTSQASAALATAVGITWTSELLTVSAVDPAGPVSVQPNSVVNWSTGTDAKPAATPTAAVTVPGAKAAPAPAPPCRRCRSTISKAATCRREADRMARWRSTSRNCWRP